MKNIILSATALSTVLLSGSVGAADLSSIKGSDAATSLVPKSGLSLGLGGNLNLATFGQQNFYWAGTSTDYFTNDGKAYGHGYAAWNTKVNLTPQFRVAPIGQINYFNHFGDSEWIWGGKFAYTYLNSRASVSNVGIPQFGAYFLQDEFRNRTVKYTSSFFGTGDLQSYQTSINNQFVLTPYLGRSFSNGFVYAGAGPSFSQVQTNLNNLTGYRNTNGTPTNQTAFGANYQNSHWVWGGAATTGITYFLTPSWYLDFNYTFSQTRSTTSYFNAWYNAPVAGTSGNDASHAIGYMPGSTSAALNTQSVNASINWILASSAPTQKRSAGNVDHNEAWSLPMWTGFYLGANIGAGWGANSTVGNNWYLDGGNGGFTNSLTATGAGGGLTGGAQLGYNYSLTPLFVVGAETDLQGSSMGSAGGSYIGPALNINRGFAGYVPGRLSGGTSIPFFGTVRARAGITLTPSLLLYGTGGFAYADVQNPAGAELQTGWAAGAGAEWMFLPNWSAKAEYLYIDVSGSNTGTGNPLNVSVKNTGGDTPWNMMRAGVNYHFNSETLQPFMPSPFTTTSPVLAKDPVAHGSLPLWTGFYAGLNAGYGFGLNNDASATSWGPQGFTTTFNGGVSNMPLSGVGLSQSGSMSNNQNGFIGGFQTGYNYQFCDRMVVGLETDIQGSNIRGGGNHTGFGYNVNGLNNATATSIGGVQISSGVDWLGTVRGRLGYLWNPSLLIYGTGGLSYGGVHANVTNQAYTFYLDKTLPEFEQGNQPFFGTSSSSQALVGWNAGGGLEWMASNNWSVKAEALYWSLGNLNLTTTSRAPGIGAPLWGLNTGLDAQSKPLLIPAQLASGNAKLNYQGVVARAGINYHFTTDALQSATSTLASGTPVFVKGSQAISTMISWTGSYAGLNSGYSFGTNDNSYASLWGPQGFTTTDNGVRYLGTMPLSGVGIAQTGQITNNQNGYLGGLQAGYNYQLHEKYVVGLETDIQGATIGGSGNRKGSGYNINSQNNGSSTTIGGVQVSSGVDWLGTIRARAGYLIKPSLLLFGTAGVSYGGARAQITNLAYSAYDDFAYPQTPNAVQPYLGTVSRAQTLIGWTAGSGLEWMVTPSWSVKAEALYWSLGTMNVGTTALSPQIGSAWWNVSGTPKFSLPGQVASGTTSINYQGVIARAGINYHFNSVSAPVVAKF
jgi:outer membrane immunogenic protein